ncbi:atypical protein kinase C-like [Gordionus sp. m RMFG-2023]|uniref:atypical protein kinase C-like n=1 Tax=Gordionus sp. m RMFG-2023 TaxID=3053472 RepID=UPI0031FCA3FF
MRSDKSMCVHSQGQAFDLYENEKEVLKIATNQNFLIGYHACFETPNNYIIAMDYACGGDLDNLIKYLGRIPEESVKFYVAELVGVSFLHSKGIFHRDLKPENVMLDKDGHIRITDYGLCKRDLSYGEKTKERVGTLDYVAPEIWRGKSYGLIGKKAIVRIPDSISDEACQKMENRLGSNPSTTIHSIASLRFFSSIDWKLLEARRVQPPYKPILPP